MKIKSNSLVTGMSGKLARQEDIVFSNRFGNIYAWRSKPYLGPFSETQIAAQNKFKVATESALADLADPVKKAGLEERFKASKGKYKTIRGMVVAHYIKNGAVSDNG